ncbi:MAG: LCP family protein [Clostridia bacterium]|nr:LCP family protein [Clostridia bacterium]
MDNLRRFLVVFVLMFFLTASICGFLLVGVYDDAKGDKVERLDVSDATYDPSSGSTTTKVFRENILFMVADSGKATPAFSAVINVDSSSNQISFLFVPQNIKYGINQTNEVGAFGEYFGRYAWNTADRATSLLSSFLDVNIDYYFTISTENFAKMIATFSSEDQGILFDIPVDIAYNKDGLEISFEAGSQYLTGPDVAKFIQFYQTEDGVYSAEMLPHYDGSDVKRLNQIQKLTHAFMTQKFTEASTNVYRDNFDELLYPYFAKSNTNLTSADLDLIASVIQNVRTNQLNYFMMNGDTVFNRKAYLEYNNTLRNLLLEDRLSTVKAEDVLISNFGTGA